MQDNKLIAKFMGWTERTDPTERWFGCFKTQDGVIHKNTPLDPLLFHSDWNWLMTVVDKIESLGATTRVKSNYNQFIKENVHQVTIEIEKGELSESNKVFLGDGFIYQNHSNSNVRKIEAYYESVVNFIKWYEQNNN